MVKQKTIQVEVDRRKWHRGKEDPALLLKNGKMCCIGFLARKLGCPLKAIRRVNILQDILYSECHKDPFVDDVQTFARVHEATLDRAYECNDQQDLTDSGREARLKVIGKEMGVKFTFTN